MVFRFLFFSLLLFCFKAHCANEKPKVLVSVAPQKCLVEKIAKDRVSVQILVPSGASPHSYEPSMHQMIDAIEGKIWFRIGEGFENRMLTVLSPRMEVVDLREGIDLLPLGCRHCNLDAHDSHIWLSPRLLKTQALTITQTLKRHFPEEASFFESNYEHLAAELDQLDKEIESRKKSCRSILVSHPAFGYFCRDYGFKQLSIEIEGKEPSPRQITTLLMQARKEEIQHVFAQPQYSVKGAERIAKELNATLEMVDPYEEDVIANLRFIANLFSK